jgi:hypothetical protein
MMNGAAVKPLKAQKRCAVPMLPATIAARISSLVRRAATMSARNTLTGTWISAVGKAEQIARRLADLERMRRLIEAFLKRQNPPPGETRH